MSRLYEVSRGLINTVNHSHTAGAGREDGDDLHDSIREPIPFNFTCLQEKWAGRGGILSTDVYSRILGPGIPLDTKYPWGCDGGPDWSCDFKFETTLRKVGFVGVSDGFHMPLSSFTQGCANDFFPDFHITSETAWRPRLHVGFCSNLDEIQGTSFTYDGPLGGGNDYVRRHAVNGWMINHKSEINFYEAYRDKEACRKSDTFVQSCDEALVASMIKKKKQKVSHIVFKFCTDIMILILAIYSSLLQDDRLILLADGYAYDVEAQQFCVGPPSLLSFQVPPTQPMFQFLYLCVNV